MSAKLDQLPGFEIAFSQPIKDSVLDYVFDPHSSLAVKVFGDDFNELRRIGNAIVAVSTAVPGVTDAAIDEYTPLPQIAIKVDRAATARYGINVADVVNLISTGIGGAAVSQLFLGDRHYDITVRFPAADRNNPEAIKSLVLTSSDGALIPLSQVAEVKLQTGESMINREMNHRYLLVKLNYHDRDPLSVVADVSKAIDQKVSFDRRKYHIEWGGQLEGQQRAEARFRLIIGLVLAAMMVLLYAEFGVLRQVFLIVGVVPLATLGGLIALHATGTTLNVASGVGFIALFGVAVMNGVIMVANLNRVREQGMPLLEAVLAGAVERLRPVLMTATVATVGMLPAALATGVGSDVQRNLATVVAGGLVPATLLTLFIIPTFYFAVERWAERRAATPSARQAAVDVGLSLRRGSRSMGQGGRAVIVLTAVWLTSCAVGPDFAPPAAPDVNGYTPEPLATATVGAATQAGGAQHFVRDLDLPGQWWTLFHSKALNSLIDKALAANPDLQAAQAALVVARENVYVQVGALLPAVDANFTGTRQKFEIGQPSDVGSGSPIYNLFTGQLNISYTPDVFGGTRRSIESLQAQQDSQRFALEATYLTLISNLAGAAVQEASLRGQIAATQSIIKIETDVLRSCASNSVSARSPRATSWRSRRHWRRSSRRCRRCKSNWRNSATCWRR